MRNTEEIDVRKRMMNRLKELGLDKKVTDEKLLDAVTDILLIIREDESNRALKIRKELEETYGVW